MCEIDLDGLELHLKEIIEDSRGDNCHTKAKNVLKLVELVREYEKDAKRYRFMRDMSDKIDVSRFFHIDVSERDAEIDDTMNHEVSDASDRVEP